MKYYLWKHFSNDNDDEYFFLTITRHQKSHISTFTYPHYAVQTKYCKLYTLYLLFQLRGRIFHHHFVQFLISNS